MVCRVRSLLLATASAVVALVGPSNAAALADAGTARRGLVHQTSSAPGAGCGAFCASYAVKVANPTRGWTAAAAAGRRRPRPSSHAVNTCRHDRHRRRSRPTMAESTESQDGNRSNEPLTTRRQILERAATTIGLGLAGLSTGLAASLGVRTAAATAAEGGEELLEEYTSPDGAFALRYPASFKGFSKPLKTHKVEVNFKSEEVKGYELGVAIDPVRIESLEKFGTPEEVGARVLKVEQGKDGTLDTKLFEATAEKQGDLSLYTLNYFVESTRGFKHFVAKVTIKDNLLYACTAQAKEKDYPGVEDQLKRVIQSFRVPA